MFKFTSFKSIISKDDISNNAIKLSSIERIFEDSFVFCQKVLGFKSANNPNTLLKTVRINSINDDIYINTKISKINNKKVKFEDLGPKDDSSVDYPDYAHKVAKKVKLNKRNVGILVCGSGTGMNIAANKHKNVRAAQCFNLKSTKLSRLHNDANIITLGSRLISKKNALKFISVFLNTKFDGGRHLKRVKKI